MTLLFVLNKLNIHVYMCFTHIVLNGHIPSDAHTHTQNTCCHLAAIANHPNDRRSIVVAHPESIQTKKNSVHRKHTHIESPPSAAAALSERLLSFRPRRRPMVIVGSKTTPSPSITHVLNVHFGDICDVAEIQMIFFSFHTVLCKLISRQKIGQTLMGDYTRDRF